MRHLILIALVSVLLMGMTHVAPAQYYGPAVGTTFEALDYSTTPNAITGLLTIDSNVAWGNGWRGGQATYIDGTQTVYLFWMSRINEHGMEEFYLENGTGMVGWHWDYITQRYRWMSDNGPHDMPWGNFGVDLREL